MTTPGYQYKVAGDDATYYSPTPVSPGMFIDGKVVRSVGNHGGPRARYS